MLEYLKEHKRTALLCALGAGALFFPGSLLMLGIGAGAGFYQGWKLAATEEKEELK